MRKPKRKKIHREWLENQLAKYERRIQKMAENAYHIRQAIEILDRQEAARNQEKGEISNAICETGIEAGAGSGSTNPDSGESELLNNELIETVLDKQPTELPVD